MVAVPVADGRTYIRDMISRACESAVTSISQALDIISGHMPKTDRIKVRRARGMMRPVRGRAMRLVRRKCTGKVPK